MSNNYYRSGIVGITWGCTPSSGLGIVTDTTKSSKCGIFQEVTNEYGQVVGVITDDVITDLTINLICTTGTAPIPGDTLTYNSNKYIVESYEQKNSQKSTQLGSVKVKSYQYITLT